MHGNDIVGALNIVLEGAPYGPNIHGAKALVNPNRVEPQCNTDDPKNLVLLVSVTPEEKFGIEEELGVVGCLRLRVVGYEMSS